MIELRPNITFFPITLEALTYLLKGKDFYSGS